MIRDITIGQYYPAKSVLHRLDPRTKFLLVPLCISAFRRANDLAMAMEARCYHGGEHRTQMKPLHYEKRDYAAYGILVAYLAVGVAFRVAGL